MTPIKILYVDDENDIREVAVMALELDPDIEVRSCSSGIEAIDIAVQWQPALILLDVMMPRMDGPATLHALRSQTATQDIPVVFITARAQPQEAEAFRALGALGVLPKPFDPMKLAAQARAMLER